MKKPVKRAPKKTYSKPVLIVYGTVQELRQSSGLPAKGDCGR